MAKAPMGNGSFSIGIGVNRGRTRNDLVHERKATSSRGQIGRGCQLSCSSNSEASSTNWQ